MYVPLVLPLFLLVLELAKVHDPTDGGFLHRGDLNQVEPCLAGPVQRVIAFQKPKLFAVVSDNSQGRSADLIVDPLLFAFDFL